ncbi:MAG: hypothetical protein WD313_04190 [Acidimicrobiia bacterium]
MSPMADLDAWLARIDAVEARLRVLATPTEGLTDADPATGEQWEAGQVWGHIAEFIQFWVEQAGDVIDAYRGEPVPFGRTRSDPTRLAGIEQGRHVAIDIMWQEVEADLADLRRFLEALPQGWSDSVGLHSTLGVIPTERVVEDFLIGHLEEHAAQLEGLAEP